MNSLLKRTTGDDAGPKLDINRYKGEGKLEEIQNSWEATERAGGRLPRVASCLHLPKRMGPNRHPFSEGRLLGRTGLKARSCWLPSGLMSWAQPIRIT